MSSEIERLVVGHTTHDRYGDQFRAGGCAYYGARVFEALDVPAHLLTAVGEDFVCDDALEGLECTVVRRGATTLFTNLYPDEGPRRQLLEAQGPTLIPEMAPDGALEAEWLHLAPVLGEIDLAEWMRKTDPAYLSIGVQGWIKGPGPRATDRAFDGAAEEARLVVQQPWAVTVDDLRGIEVACLSDEDLRDQGDLFERLTETIPVVVRTHADAGVTVVVEGEARRVGAHPSDIIDPTGAGDTFAAGLLARLGDGASPVEAARFGSACASLVIEGQATDALERLPDEADTRAETIDVE